MGLLMVSSGKYTNNQAIRYVLEYVTRIGKNASRRNELISYGFLGASNNPEEAIRQFYIIQRRLRASYIGKRIFQEILQLKKEETDALINVQWLYQSALECAYYYYNTGHQVCFAIHNDREKGCHIHFVINPVNFYTGGKWHNDYDNEKIRESVFNEILLKNQNNAAQSDCIMRQYIIPIYFELPKCEKNYYVVANGRRCGVFDDWYMCKEEIENYKGSKFKQVKTLDSALIYISSEMDYREEYVIYLNGYPRWFNDYLKFVAYLEYLEKYE